MASGVFGRVCACLCVWLCSTRTTRRSTWRTHLAVVSTCAIFTRRSDDVTSGSTSTPTAEYPGCASFRRPSKLTLSVSTKRRLYGGAVSRMSIGVDWRMASYCVQHASDVAGLWTHGPYDDGDDDDDDDDADASVSAAVMKRRTPDSAAESLRRCIHYMETS